MASPLMVMNLDVSDTMRGHQVKKASSSAKQVSLKEFVTSGGGQKGEAHLKKAMQKELLAKQAEVRKKLDEASNTIGQAETRTRVMNRALKQVEAMPDAQAQALLPGEAAASDEEADA